MMSIRCRSTYKGDDVDDVNKKEGAQSRHNVDLMLLKIIMPTLNRINKYNAKRYWIDVDHVAISTISTI